MCISMPTGEMSTVIRGRDEKLSVALSSRGGGSGLERASASKAIHIRRRCDYGRFSDQPGLRPY